MEAKQEALTISESMPHCLMRGRKVAASTDTPELAVQILCALNAHDDLIKERDELLSILKAFKDVNGTFHGWHDSYRDATERADAILARLGAT